MAIRPDQPVLVGRERERRQLLEVVDHAVDGQGTLLLVSGEAGIGKTALVEDLILRVAHRNLLVLSGGAYEVTTTPPYGPWVEIIRSIPDGHGVPSVPEQLRVGGGMAGIDSQAALFDLSARYLASVAAVRPLVLLLEDLHWADPASLDLLRYLSREFTDVPVLLVATYRDDEITPGHHLFELLPAMLREGRVERIHLQRLDRDAVSSLVREQYRIGHADEERLIDYLDGLAEGNPFFINELLFTLAERQILWPVAGGWELGDLDAAALPPVIQQVINGRLARIGPDARDLLGIAAVIGYDAPLDLLRGLYDGPDAELDRALQLAIDHHLIALQSGQSSVRFSHALVRQTIYEAIPPLRRRALHRRVGELLASRSRPDPSDVASHFYAAGDERALEWLIRAAKHAQALFAPQSVIGHAGRGIALADRLSLDEPLDLYRLRALARESAGDFDGARVDHETVLERARERGNRDVERQALLDLGMLWAFQDYERTREFYEHAVDLAREMDDPVALGHSLNRLGNWYVNAEQPSDAIRQHREALEIFHAAGDRDGIARTLDFTAMDHLMVGDLARSLQHYERAIPILREMNEQQTLASAIANVGVASWGDWGAPVCRIQTVPESLGGDAVDCLNEAIEIARSIEWRSGESHILGARGQLLASAGDLRSGLRDLAESLEIANQIQHHQWRAHAHLRTGAIFLELGHPDRARRSLERALEIAMSISSSFFATGAAALLATAYAREGVMEEAERLLLPRIAPGQALEMFSIRICWFAFAELHLARNRPDEAIQAIERLIMFIPDGPGDISPDLLLLRGQIRLALDCLDDAQTDLEEARAAADRLGHRLVLWRILAVQCRLFVAQGRAMEARKASDAAREIVDDLAGQLDDKELRAEFLENVQSQLSGSLPYVSEQPAIYGGLTPREIEVLRAVAEGLTDAEAGERLFISARTVSQHLRSIYNKLDANNRAAAVRIAVEQGLV